jgi:hypothetical protein
MREVVLVKRKPTEIMEIVRELRARGLVQGTDFDFRYNQTKYNSIDHETIAPEHTVFIFYDEKYATYFILTYGAN